MIHNRRAAIGPSWEFLLSLIIGLMIVMVFGFVFIEYLQTQQTSKESFNKLIETITELQEGTITWNLLELPEEFILVHFSDSASFKGETLLSSGLSVGACWENVDFPAKSCEQEGDCLCICSGFLMTDYDEACTKNPIACYSFPKGTTLYDTACDAGVYREGTAGGVTTLYLQKQDSIIRFCENNRCLSESDNEASDNFESYMQQWEMCKSSTTDCECQLSDNFLGDKYAMRFHADSVELINRATLQRITEYNTETKLSLTNLNNPELNLTDGILYNRFSEESSPLYGSQLLRLLTPNGKPIPSSGYTTSSYQSSVSSYPEKQGTELFYVKQATGLPACTAAPQTTLVL